MNTSYADHLGTASSLVLPDVKAEITLGKDTLPYFDSLEIKQYHDKFHEFTLIIDHDVLEEAHAYNPEQSRDLVGEILNVTLKQTNGSGGENYFKGIVTSLALRQGEGYHGKLLLQGHSPDFLLDGQPHLQCFYQESLADIVDKLSASLKAVQSKIEVKPARSGGVEYACQFRESNYAFLKRLAADLGEWFFFDGRQLFFGKPKDGEVIPLVYGRDSDRMSLKMRVKPLSFGRFAYDAASDGFTAFKAPLALKGIGDFGSLTLGKAKKLFKEEGLMPVPFPQVGEGAAQSRLERQSADLSLLEGESRNHLLHPGAVVDLKFSVKAEQLFEHKPSGRYRILEAVHHLDAKGRYKNSFRAIPADSPMLPQQHAERPKTEPQLAVVTDNNDPEGLGRVRVKFLWQDGDVFTPFLRILRPDFGAAEQGGANRGYFWIPEIGDQVLVQFFEGMPEQPYVAGALGHGKNKASGHLVNNHLKSISTRTGHTIEFNDADGGTSITIKDPAGNEIFLDTQGRNITITAPETVTINAKNIVMNAEQNITSSAGENIAASAGNDIMHHAAGNINETSDTRTEMVERDFHRQANVSNEVAGEVSMFSMKENMTMQSGKTVEFNSAEKAKMF